MLKSLKFISATDYYFGRRKAVASNNLNILGLKLIKQIRYVLAWLD